MVAEQSDRIKYLNGRTVAVNPDFVPGAINAVHVCLRLQPNERITIISGEECQEIVAALVDQVETVGAEYRVLFLEDYSPRPCLHLPHDILVDMKKSQVSFYLARPQPGELQHRTEVTRFVTAHHMRHGHMVNISPQIMVQGMCADFHKIDELSTRLIERAQNTHLIHAKTPAGTDIIARFSPHLNWLKTSGIISEKKWGNLPGGEILTSPARVDGIFVVDGVVGDYLCEMYGDLRETPLTIEIENSRIKALLCANKRLLQDFAAYTATDENSNRVGEFAIGTNLWVKDVIGNILQDEKIPGIHLAFGDPYWEHTGADWTSDTHIDCVGRDFDIWMDGEQIMRKGQFLL